MLGRSVSKLVLANSGQKQRISVARAAYSDADVFIFDDPLSALDPEVAENVFEQTIVKMLQGKTRLLVTNQLQCLPRCDMVIALGKKGRVLEQGSYNDLISNDSGEVTRLLKGVAPSRRNLMQEEEQNKDAEPKEAQKVNKKLMTSEERQTGTVKLNVYLKYIKAGGGYLLFSVVFFSYILSTGTNVAASVWVSIWTADSGYKSQTE